MEYPKHKVFISYYHHDDQFYKDELLRQNSAFNLFEDYSVHENEIDDTGKNDETIRQIIRDQYIKDATVLILLCGLNTSKRKHIDWELHAAMFNTENNPKMGIIVVNLPEIKQWVRAHSDEEKELVLPGNKSWVTTSTRKDFEEKFPYMPRRIIDNFVAHVPISVVNWDRINNNPDVFRILIDNAYKRKWTNQYDHSALLSRYNS